MSPVGRHPSKQNYPYLCSRFLRCPHHVKANESTRWSGRLQTCGLPWASSEDPVGDPKAGVTRPEGTVESSAARRLLPRGRRVPLGTSPGRDGQREPQTQVLLRQQAQGRRMCRGSPRVSRLLSGCTGTLLLHPPSHRGATLEKTLRVDEDLTGRPSLSALEGATGVQSSRGLCLPLTSMIPFPRIPRLRWGAHVRKGLMSALLTALQD